MFEAKPNGILLTRDVFRESVFARDRSKCVICGAPGKDAHHIMERRLFPDGGYYLANGATVCEEHHLQAESTVLSCEQLRAAAAITAVVLPPHLYRDQAYDKWGNPILDNGTRLRGELFQDDSVQKVLSPVLHLFSGRVKYPRTYHLWCSPGATDDDRLHTYEDDVAAFAGQEIVIMEKMDGENTTMYRDYIHARSLDYTSDLTRDRVKALWAEIAYDIPEDWRICGENLYAKHSILYTKLESFFLVFSVWNEQNYCLSWDETKQWAELLGLKTVPEIFCGLVEDFDSLIAGVVSDMNLHEQEGFVVRRRQAIHYRDFRRFYAKYVREGHVQTSHHWRRQTLELNQVRS